MRPLPLALATLVLAGTLAPSAHGAALSTTNTCRWSIDDYYRDLPIELRGTGSPTPATPGAPVTLGGSAVHSRLPDWVPEYGYNLGLLHEGKNDIPATVWVASTDGAGAPRVTSATVTAVTTITLDGNGDPVGTPLDVTVPLPDSGWTAPGSGALALTQAGPGTLPKLPIGPSGQQRQPGGSIVIQAALDDNAKIVLDCHPGRSKAGGTTYDTIAAGAFESVPVQEPPAPDPGVPAPAPTPPPAPAATPVVSAPIAGPAPVLRSTRLRATKAGRVPLSVGCGAGTGACFGTLEVRTVSRQKVGTKTAIVTVGRVQYAVPAGGSRAVDLGLSATARSLLRRRSQVAVRARLLPRETPTVAAASKQLTLRRP